MADGMSKLRLDKYLADMGVGTRQEVKALIRKGRVAVDGITAKAPELKVDPDEAQVTVDGNNISYVKMEYWMLHKPAGVVSATEDRRDRTVLDLLSDAARKDLFPVGRARQGHRRAAADYERRSPFPPAALSEIACLESV